jgi:hypothetical protein
MVWVNTSPLVKTYTLEEFWELPEPPDHLKVELIAGVLYLTPLLVTYTTMRSAGSTDYFPST